MNNFRIKVSDEEVAAYANIPVNKEYFCLREPDTDHDEWNADCLDYFASVRRQGASVCIECSAYFDSCGPHYSDAIEFSRAIVAATEEAQAFLKAQMDYVRMKKSKLDVDLIGVQSSLSYDFDNGHYRVTFEKDGKDRLNTISEQTPTGLVVIFRSLTPDSWSKTSVDDAALLLKVYLTERCQDTSN